jgi:translation initiation factor IF-2
VLLAGRCNKINERIAPKPVHLDLLGSKPNKITPNTGGGGFNANRSARPGF